MLDSVIKGKTIYSQASDPDYCQYVQVISFKDCYIHYSENSHYFLFYAVFFGPLFIFIFLCTYILINQFLRIKSEWISTLIIMLLTEIVLRTDNIERKLHVLLEKTSRGKQAEGLNINCNKMEYMVISKKDSPRCTIQTRELKIMQKQKRRGGIGKVKHAFQKLGNKNKDVQLLCNIKPPDFWTISLQIKKTLKEEY